MSTGTGRLEQLWGGFRERLHRRPELSIGLVTAVVVMLFHGAVLGLRGLGPAAATLSKAAQSGVRTAASALQTPHPLPELLAGALGTAGLPALPVLDWVGLTAVAVGAVATGGIASKLSGRLSAVLAAAVFATLPQVAGAATTVGTGALFVGAWAVFLRLCVVERHRWYDTLGLWVLGAALLLTWPPFLLWGAVWLALELREADWTADDGVSLVGEYRQTALPVAILVAPFAVVGLATLLHPALLVDPWGGWKTFGKFAFTWTGPTFEFAGVAYPEHRPPPWTGLVLAWWTLPAVVSLGALAGWLHVAASNWRPNRTGRLAQRMCLWGLPLAAALPWLHRGPSWGELHYTVVLAPFVAVTAGCALHRGLEAATGLVRRRVGGVAGDWFRPGGVVLIVALLAGTSVGAHPVQGSYYNSLAGGFSGAIDRGLPVSRDSVYPVEVLRRARDRAEADTAAVVGEQSLVAEYRRLGVLEGLSQAGSLAEADVRIRRLGNFEAGARSAASRPGAVVDLTGQAAPILRVDGVPVFWAEW